MGLSVIIITKNEEHNIRRCLESVQFAEQIVVVDSGSEDNTVQIAKEYTPFVQITSDWPGYGAQKQRALSQATQDWVLNLDADEVINEALQKEIQTAIALNEADAYRIPIKMYFYNKPLHYGSSPKRHARLFKRQGASFSTDIVHEKIMLPDHAVIGRLKSAIEHHSFKDISHVLYKINKYSSYSAKTYLAKGRKTNFLKNLINFHWMFFRCYVLQRGFLDGKVGFLFALFNAQGTFYRGIKQLYQDSQIEKLPDLSSEKESL